MTVPANLDRKLQLRRLQVDYKCTNTGLAMKLVAAHLPILQLPSAHGTTTLASDRLFCCDRRFSTPEILLWSCIAIAEFPKSEFCK
jgi:hypothetical protein